MERPLTHTGMSVSTLQDPVGKLVYVMGDPQKIGIVRHYRPGHARWDGEVYIEWMSGRATWKRIGPVVTIDSKIAEEERVLSVLKERRAEARKHFGV